MNSQSNEKCAVDLRMAKRFKLRLLGKGPVTAQVFSSDIKLKGQSAIHNGTFRQISVDLETANNYGLDVGLCIQRTDGKGRKNENVLEIVCLVLDDDETRDTVRSFPLKPHFVIESSPGRFHYYWKVSGVTPAGYSKVAAGLAEKFGGDRAVVDPSRVMRWAGFINHKRSQPFLVREVATTTSNPYEIEEFAREMGLTAADMTEGNPAPQGKITTPDDLRPRICAALASIDPDPYRTWITVLMGMQYLSSQGHAWALEEAREYSKRSAKYDEAEFDKKWASFGRTGRSVITERSILYLARLSAPAKDADTTAIPGEDLDNGDLVVASLVDAGLRFLGDAKQWTRFGVDGWSRCDEAAAFGIAKETARRARSAAFGATDRTRVAAAGRLGSLAGVSAALAVAKMDERVRLDSATFDRERTLVGVENGVLDLETKELLARTSELKVMRRMNAAFDPAAKCPTFERFIRQITEDDDDLRRYIKKLLGYVLCGTCDHHILPVFYGTGRNGKGTLVDTIQSLLGDYASQVQANVFMDRRFGSGGPTPELAQLPGVRFLNVTEIEKTRRMDHALLKQISGQDTISCRGLYQAPFVFKPMFTAFLVSNHRMQLDSDDEALWERVHVVPFDAHFPAAAQDRSLRDRLKAEASGILNWLLNGHRGYLKEGLQPPSRVIQTTSAYRFAADVFMRWYNTRCGRVDEARTPSRKLYDDYVLWSQESSQLPIDDRRFKARLESLGHKCVKHEKGHFYTGIRLNSE